MTAGLNSSRIRTRMIVVAVAAFNLAACGLNALPALQERARAAWSEVQNQYQRRIDLIPKLVATVKALTPQEEELLQRLTEARAQAARVQADAATPSDGERFREYEAAQAQLSRVLGWVWQSVERYPELKSNAGFVALRSQLLDTEDRIAVARRDYAAAAERYNRELEALPGRWIAAGFHPEAKPMALFSGPAGERSR
jgi:LemA protein